VTRDTAALRLPAIFRSAPEPRRRAGGFGVDDHRDRPLERPV